MNECYIDAAKMIRTADGMLITAGAGMGVDSGLPDFRGGEGFWKAYPMLTEKRSFIEMANPAVFYENPKLAWGFYGHRLSLYQSSVPHDGFSILQSIAKKLRSGAFVFTSNVDGQFQKAGFDEHTIVECHGSIHHLQCSDPCREEIWSAEGWRPRVNMSTLELDEPLPVCPFCGGLARPNILMFDDWRWIADRYTAQKAKLERWMDRVRNLVVIEIGAGTAVPTVRLFSENAGGELVRINPANSHLGKAISGVSIETGGLTALKNLTQLL